MAKERLCTNCTYNNNGWCNKRKTNKGLKDLSNCEYRKTNNLAKLQSYYEQKKWEYENIDNEHNIFNQGSLIGLEIAIKIMSE
ncbi:hypothetical protein ACQPVP_15850 [Clostridium nigeriense]|uniref:hypothetical protein n=1 Tax=Clostridium nigeriense TaxID=1805470 RepID=UPI003D33B8FD